MSDKDTGTGSGPVSGTRLWVRLVLFASLAVNMLVIGAVVGTVAMHGGGPDDRRRPPRADQIAGPLTHALDHEERREIGRAIRSEYRKGRPSRGAMKAEYDAVIQALRTEPFDATAVRDSFERQQAYAVDRMKIGQGILLDKLVAMTPEQRAAFADRLEDGLTRFDEGRGKGKGKDGKDRDN